MQADSVLNLPDDIRMLDVVRQGLARAEEALLAVSFTRCSGLGLLADPIREMVERGGKIRLLTSTYMSLTQPEALRALHSIDGVSTRLHDGKHGFHSKFWWFGTDGSAECWVGSSNLTKGGLASNIEWNLRGTDAGILQTTRDQFDTLWRRPDTEALSTQLIRDYERIYRARESRPSFVSVAADGDYGASVEPNAAQREALGKLALSRSQGQHRAAVIAATGVGKTFLAAFDARAAKAETLLYVSHRLEHLTQAVRAFTQVFRGERRMGLVRGGKTAGDADFVFATVASLRNRPELVARGFDYLVIDEFHHAEAPSYAQLKTVRDQAFLLGITATPERADGRDVLEWCDYNVAYEVRLPQAVDRGWLLPFHYFGIADESIDFLQIPWRKLEAVEDALSVDVRAELILREAIEKGFDGLRRATVGFCAGRKHAEFMAEAFRKRGEPALAVLGDKSVAEREQIYDRLADPRDPLEWIFVADLLNEGVDIPAINSILFLRPTDSSTVFLQQLGRGLRLCPGSEVLTVLDFVGHHKSSWLSLTAMDAPSSAGRRTELADGVVIKPPKHCEVVLQRRTREILAKVARVPGGKKSCNAAYVALREELGRPVRPVDLWNRHDVPEFTSFRSAHKTWLACQIANEDAPRWLEGARADHPVFGFLKAIESNWVAQRVWNHALLWALCAVPEAPERGYEAFYERWEQWKVEYAPLQNTSAWKTLQKKLGPSLVDRRLHPEIRELLGSSLLAEVEGRILYILAGDHSSRHGGVLRTPLELVPFARYDRPEVVRHFGVQYDPTKHNKGILWIEGYAVIMAKLDTSGAKQEYLYANALLGNNRFSWTSQNQMYPGNELGRRIIEHKDRGIKVYLFLQPRANAPTMFMGECVFESVRHTIDDAATGPMNVIFELAAPVSSDARKELGLESS